MQTFWEIGTSPPLMMMLAPPNQGLAMWSPMQDAQLLSLQASNTSCVEHTQSRICNSNNIAA
eukprot:9733278-Ditylum_brightwellii.AAC.1